MNTGAKNSSATKGASATLSRTFDWGQLGPLRLRARLVAEGLYSGAHKSVRRGSGVEFGGFRAYYPGDDLRFIDRRALLRFDKLQVREFETETERAVRVLVDGSASMRYRGGNSPGSKYAFASLLAAALGHVTLRGGDPFGVSVFGAVLDPALGRDTPGRMGLHQVPLSGSRDTFERTVALLESLQPDADLSERPDILRVAFESLVSRARLGSFIVVFSDLLDIDEASVSALAELSQRRRLVVVQVLDDDEVTFPFEGSFRLRSLEGNIQRDTDSHAKATYLAALAELTARWENGLTRRGARLLRVVSNENPSVALARLLRTAF